MSCCFFSEKVVILSWNFKLKKTINLFTFCRLCFERLPDPVPRLVLPSLVVFVVAVVVKDARPGGENRFWNVNKTKTGLLSWLGTLRKYPFWNVNKNWFGKWFGTIRINRFSNVNKNWFANLVWTIRKNQFCKCKTGFQL